MTLSDGTMFDTISTPENYKMALGDADGKANVEDYVLLIRGLLKVWPKEKPDCLPVGKSLYASMNDRLDRNDLKGIGCSLHREGNSITVCQVPVMIKE